MGSDDTISIPDGYVCFNENHLECGLRLVKSLLGLRLERQNQLFLRHSSTILLDPANSIWHHTYQEKFWLEELDKMMYQDAHACKQLCKQFCKAPGLTYKLNNYKLVYSNDSDSGLLLDTDVGKAENSSNSEVDGFKCSTVSTLFDLWSRGDHLSRIYPYKLTDAYYMTSSGTFLVP
jgi:hypothetical protein